MRNLKYQITLVLVFMLQLTQAQPAFGNDDVQDVPINDWILPSIAIITAVMFVSYRKQLKNILLKTNQ